MIETPSKATYKTSYLPCKKCFGMRTLFKISTDRCRLHMFLLHVHDSFRRFRSPVLGQAIITALNYILPFVGRFLLLLFSFLFSFVGL